MQLRPAKGDLLNEVLGGFNSLFDLVLGKLRAHFGSAPPGVDDEHVLGLADLGSHDMPEVARYQGLGHVVGGVLVVAYVPYLLLPPLETAFLHHR